eukprot:10533909-Ditylum_brightwellii.AAC.1
MYLINALQDFHKEYILAQLPLYCDNKAAVHTANSDASPGIRAHFCSDYNIVSAIRAEKRTNITWT